MTIGLSPYRRRAAVVLLMCPLLAACLPSRSHDGAESFAKPTAQVTIGTALALGSLDPASGDPDLALVAANIYQRPLRMLRGSGSLAPEAATCGFQDQTTYVCALVPGQAFSNGDPVTAQDLAFSIRRSVKLAKPGAGEAAFTHMTKIVAVGNTVTFTLDTPDATWPSVLASNQASIVDRRVFRASHLLDSVQVVGSGPYELGAVSDQSIEFVPNPHYGGSDHLANAKVVVKIEADPSLLVSDLQSGAVDVAFGGLSALQSRAAQAAAGISVVAGGGQEVRGLAFDDKTQPGTNEAHKLAVRQAVAELVDRATIATTVYHDAVAPLYSIESGDSSSPAPTAAPDVTTAQQTLTAAGITPTVPMTLWYNADHLEDAGLATELARELNGSGLFDVKLKTADWAVYDAAARSGSYGVFLFGWYSDQVGTQLAQDVPIIPIWQGSQPAMVRAGIAGAAAALAVPGVITFRSLATRAAE